jgi:hypothetical protein
VVCNSACNFDPPYGAEILRLATIAAEEAGLGVAALVHDAMMIEAPVERIDADTAVLREIMRRAARTVIGIDIRVDYETVRYPDRYMDMSERDDSANPRRKTMWRQIMDLLAEVEQSSEAAA